MDRLFWMELERQIESAAKGVDINPGNSGSIESDSIESKILLKKIALVVNSALHQVEFEILVTLRVQKMLVYWDIKHYFIARALLARPPLSVHLCPFLSTKVNTVAS